MSKSWGPCHSHCFHISMPALDGSLWCTCRGFQVGSRAWETLCGDVQLIDWACTHAKLYTRQALGHLLWQNMSIMGFVLLLMPAAVFLTSIMLIFIAIVLFMMAAFPGVPSPFPPFLTWLNSVHHSKPSIFFLTGWMWRFLLCGFGGYQNNHDDGYCIFCVHEGIFQGLAIF